MIKHKVDKVKEEQIYNILQNVSKQNKNYKKLFLFLVYKAKHFMFICYNLLFPKPLI